MLVEMEITIINRLGLHARACAKLVKAAAHYESRIELLLQLLLLLIVFMVRLLLLFKFLCIAPAR